MKTTSSAPHARAALHVLLLSVAAMWPLTASAYRPFNSTDAAVAAKGEMERVREGLSLDAAVRRARAGGASTTELRAGLTWAFGVGFPR